MWFTAKFGRAASAGIAVLLLIACSGPASAPTRNSSPPAAAGTSAVGKPAPDPAAGARPAGSAAASAPAKVAIKSAYTTTAATSVPFWMAKETGAFAAEGLDVTLTRVAPGGPILAALESGDVPIAAAGGQEVVDAQVKGASLVIVGGFGDKLTNSIMTIPSIATPDDLRGKSLGVSGYGSVSHLAGRVAVDKLGLKGQVTFVATGGLPQTLAAIQGGKVQGGMLSPPQTFDAQKQGLHQLYDLSASDVRSATSIVVTTRKYAAEQPDVVEHFLRAIIRSVHRAYVDKPAAIATLATYGGIGDPEVAARTYDYFVNGALWGKDGMPTMEGLQQNLDSASAEGIDGAGSFKPQQLVDTTFVRKIQASGLIENLYGRPLPLTL